MCVALVGGWEGTLVGSVFPGTGCGCTDCDGGAGDGDCHSDADAPLVVK